MQENLLYGKLARYYDKLNANIDYKKQVDFILTLMEKKGILKDSLLDVGCGTGNHLMYFKDKIKMISGLEKSNEMLEIARKKLPGVNFINGNMKEFSLNRLFNVIICMFGVISYNEDYTEVHKTLNCFHKHLEPGGIAVIDLEFSKEDWMENGIWMEIVNEENLKIARLLNSKSKGNKFIYNPVFLIKEDNKVDFEIDEHILSIFETEKIKGIMEKVGLKTEIYSDFEFTHWEERKKRAILAGIKK